MEVQLDLFEEYDEVSLLKKEISALEETMHNVRKGLFKRHNELVKEIIKLTEEIDRMRILMIKQVK